MYTLDYRNIYLHLIACSRSLGAGANSVCTGTSSLFLNHPHSFGKIYHQFPSNPGYGKRHEDLVFAAAEVGGGLCSCI